MNAISGGKIYYMYMCIRVSNSERDFFTLGELLFFVRGELPTLIMLHAFFYGVRVMRAAAIPILFEAVVPIPHIGVILPNRFRHSNGTLKTDRQRLKV